MKRLVVWAAVEFVLLAICVVARTAFWSYGADTGTFAQLIASGPGMRDVLEAGTHFRFHWSPTLILLWPLAALARNGFLIQLVQAAAVAATAPLLAALFRPYLGETLSLRFGAVALLYPPLVALGFDEFHELGLFAPLAIGMLLAADRGNWRWYAVCTLLAIGLREDICIELALLGIALSIAGVRLHRRQLAVAGGATTLAAASALALYFGAVVPSLGGWNPSHFYEYSFANGPVAVIFAVFTHPFDVARVVFQRGKFTYVLEALAPLAFLPLLTRWWLIALPGFAMVLLANDAYVWRMGDHYAALWIPWLLVAAGCALVILRKRSETIARTWTGVAAALSVVVLIAFDPMHPLHYLRPSYHDLADVRRAFSCVPHDAVVATQDEWYAQESVAFPHATTATTPGAAYLVYALDYPNAAFRATVLPAVKAAVRRGEYRPVCRYGDVVVYRRRESRPGKGG